MSYSFFCGDGAFHCTARMKPESSIVMNFVSFLIFVSAWVFCDHFFNPPPLPYLYGFVLFILIERRLHLKWPRILKVPAKGDDNH